MRVADFFCGAGGFSEGFRQKGFEVVFAVDNWKPAQETHKFNHPSCRHPGLDCFEDIKGDILAIDTGRIDEIVPDTEVIVGSPPCVSFSSSNKAGKADKGLGIILIEKYLQIIAVKKHKPKSVLKYWALENVPNSQHYVKEKYTFADLGLDAKMLNRFGIKKKPSDIALETKIRGVFNAADYGAPQTRKRFVCGDFPEPEKTHVGKWITMKQVMKSLGSPYGRNGEKVTDPVYGFSIPSSQLTDHHYDPSVAQHEWERARHLKEDHGFMGKMSFPEELDRPSRTIMATQSAVSRESVIFATESKKAAGQYRLPTIREIGTFMSFPITYQFIGNNESTKYKLVGNAVCVRLSAAVAEAIMKAEGKKVKTEPNPHKIFSPPPMDLTGRKREMKTPSERRTQARFRKHVPYMKIRSFRVDIDNHSSDFAKERFRWKASIHQGSGMASWKNAEPTLEQADRLISQTLNAKEFKADVAKRFGKMPDAQTLQARFCRTAKGDGPEELLEQIADVVEDHYPRHETEGDLDNRKRVIKIEKDDIPVCIAAALYAACYIVEQVKKS